MYAIGKNLETCARGQCCQPVEEELGHLQPGSGSEADQFVWLGYCAPHAENIRQRRLLGLER